MKEGLVQKSEEEKGMGMEESMAKKWMGKDGSVEERATDM